MELPKYNEQRRLADKGISIVKKIVEEELKWIFRKISLDDDFGLDGYIDILQDGKYVTGKSIGVQIKTGISYFDNPSNSGWFFYGENKHLNYYLNNHIPIIVILVNPDTQQAYWNEVNISNLIKTESSWKLNINRNKLLNNKSDLSEIAGDYIDYAPQLDYISKVNEEMIESGLIFIAIDRTEIEEENYEGIKLLLKWLIASDEMIVKCRNKLMITVFGYDDDSRELFQIESVRNWMKSVLPIFKYWGYFLSMEEKVRKLSTLRILLFCNIDVNYLGHKEAERVVEINYKTEDAHNFKMQIFEWLNEFAHIYNIEEKIVFEQSMLIHQTVDGLTDEEVSEMRKKYGFS
jgi:hypothetical protein